MSPLPDAEVPVAPALLFRVMAQNRRRSRGYTLIESLITIGIMAIVLGIGVPRLSRLRSPYIMSGATRQIAAHLQAARQRAIARNVSYRLNFNPSAKTYTIERQVGANWVVDGATFNLPAGASLGTITPGNQIAFDTRGMLAANATIPVTVTGSGTKNVNVNVLGKTTIGG